MRRSKAAASAQDRARVALSIFLIAGAVWLLQAGASWLGLPGVHLDNSFDLRDIRRPGLVPVSGPDEAARTVVVFTDYQCAVCRADERVLRSAFADPTVRVVVKEWAILGPASVAAARLALAASYQGRYRAARRALMEAGSVRTARDREQALARAGIDRIRLQHDLERHGRQIDQDLNRASRHAFALGLRGTPAYLIGSRLVTGGLSRQHFDRIRAAELETLGTVPER